MSSTLLKLQIGPVQDFIAQARSTRDLWSGSFLISWMSAQFLRCLRGVSTEVDFVFPRVPTSVPHDDPTFPPTVAWSEGHKADAPRSLLAAVPNLLLAEVPATVGEADIRATVARVFGYAPSQVWREISDKCYEFLQVKGTLSAIDREHWDEQLRSFWQTTWQMWPLDGGAKAKDLFLKTPIGESARQLTDSFDEWTISYHLLSHRLDARRQTRNFTAWRGRPNRDKDALSGREECLIDDKWIKALRAAFADLTENDDSADAERIRKLFHLFRKDDQLGAPTLVKRVWHLAYLEQSQGFRKPRGERQGQGDSYFNMPSLAGIAGFPWGVAVRKALKGSAKLDEFHKAVRTIGRFADVEFAKPARKESPEDWLERVDWQVFQESFWQAEIREAEIPAHAQAGSRGLAALRDLLSERHLGSPEQYYAVLAMDGDGVGRWLSGEKTGGVLTRDFHADFSRQMSRATAGKGLLFDDLMVREVVEDPHELGVQHPHPFAGKVVYAGADDVLAILPAVQAFDCARALRRAIQDVMAPATKLWTEEPFTISAGVAIGHIKEPLQDMIETAQRELRRAKDNYGGDAMAVTLFKRSGEHIQWAAGMDSSAFPLLEEFRRGYRPPALKPNAVMPISGRFPHCLSEMVRRFDTGQTMTEALRRIVLAEYEHVLKRQVRAGDDFKDPAELRLVLRLRGECYARELECLHRPLGDFCNLFNIEAFIARQGK